MSEKKVIVTFGGTEEPIDGVRSISNFSTGATGAFISDYFAGRKAEVFSVHAKRAKLPEKPVIRFPFTDFSSLDSLLKKLLSENYFHCIVHLAAVSDYSVDTVTAGQKCYSRGSAEKINSEIHEEITIRLKRNFKILDRLKMYSSNKDIKVVGFKLTNRATSEECDLAVKKAFLSQKVDFIVQNELTDISADRHPAKIYSPTGLVRTAKNKPEMAEALFDLLFQSSDGIKSI
ncbi:MAG: hypothetical protein HQM10_17620 [Candidatus Riflebacteria bacterium]|nr:hypothetical protein [Candidatus Riflebacteria bacterium]